MGIGNANNFKQSLNIAVFPIAAMQRIKADIRLYLAQGFRDIPPDVDRGYLIAAFLQRLSTGKAAVHRHFPLSGPAAH